ncbi:MAG TPA: glycosyltransferase family 4 protein [Chitinophagaceae bacterium]
MKNFLSIVWYRVLPPAYGGQKGIADFNDHLGRSVPLTCLCSRNNNADTALSYKLLNVLPVSRSQSWNPFVRNQILSFIKKRSFSHIIIEHPYHAWLGKYRKKIGFRFIVHAHNIEHLRMKARGKLWWRWIRRTEQFAFSSADHILFKTEADKAVAISVFNIDPAKCLIVPYGIKETGQPVINTAAKEQLKKKYNISADEKVLLFAGTLDYEPNAKAVEMILHHIVPSLQKKKFQFRLLICGALHKEKAAELNAIPGVTATGFVASIQHHFQLADVFINPVTKGSGIQTKNIEAIANGCTVVSTSFAAIGLPGYLLEKKLFISHGDDWEQFTGNIIKAASLQNDVPEQFYQDYNWQNIIDRLLSEIG